MVTTTATATTTSNAETETATATASINNPTLSEGGEQTTNIRTSSTLSLSEADPPSLTAIKEEEEHSENGKEEEEQQQQKDIGQESYVDNNKVNPKPHGTNIIARLSLPVVIREPSRPFPTPANEINRQQNDKAEHTRTMFVNPLGIARASLPGLVREPEGNQTIECQPTVQQQEQHLEKNKNGHGNKADKTVSSSWTPPRRDETKTTRLYPAHPLGASLPEISRSTFDNASSTSSGKSKHHILGRGRANNQQQPPERTFLSRHTRKGKMNDFHEESPSEMTTSRIVHVGAERVGPDIGSSKSIYIGDDDDNNALPSSSYATAIERQNHIDDDENPPPPSAIQVEILQDSSRGSNSESTNRTRGGRTRRISQFIIHALHLDPSTTPVAQVVDQRKERRRKFISCAATLVIFSGLVIAIALLVTQLGNNNSNDDDDADICRQAKRSRKRKDIFSQCICGDEIRFLPPETNQTIRQLVASFIIQQGIWSSDIPVHSCLPENQALIWLSNPHNSEFIDMTNLENITTNVTTLDDYNITIPSTQRQYRAILQRFVMVLFWIQMQGREWERSNGWLTSAHECEWFGIHCSFSLRVESILLESNGLRGRIPSTLSRLELLQIVDLGGNKGIAGTIPSELGQLSFLEELDLRNDGLTGTLPFELSQLESIARLFFQNNSLEGTIPSSFGNFERLRTFYLDDNQLTGTIPSSFGNPLSRISTWSVARNRLVGTLPSELGLLRFVNALGFQSNQFSGTIPSSLASLSRLTSFGLQFNRMNGTFPDVLATSFEKRRLNFLGLNGNEFTGTISSNICNSLFLDFLVVDCTGNFTLSCPCCSCVETLPTAIGNLV